MGRCAWVGRRGGGRGRAGSGCRGRWGCWYVPFLCFVFLDLACFRPCASSTHVHFFLPSDPLWPIAVYPLSFHLPLFLGVDSYL
ncbi:hypothetical protein DFH06DRAFT_1220872 [Mycena polygramma]|nr:hypothetical protein DFH06DRAFT_1220872 [Mycena polygramma]